MTFELLVQEREDKAYARGREEGREENKIEMVRNLFTTNLSFEEIARVVGWSEEKILQLANDE